jgi:hypothetical protein
MIGHAAPCDAAADNENTGLGWKIQTHG